LNVLNGHTFLEQKDPDAQSFRSRDFLQDVPFSWK
jgi:hypothetical protein